jgi:two-component system CheB/CheR fusion protein
MPAPEGRADAAPAGSGGADALSWVAIGASAGGLEALRDLAHHLPADLPATYIVLQHMAPQHRSLLATLIGRETSLPCTELADGTRPERNHIYVVPPNHDVTVDRGALRLQSPSVEIAAPKPSIDRFLVSLAEALHDRAVGIVLSGTGSDGAWGIQAIRAAGGITIAQEEASAKYGGMPSAAIATGCIDLVLTPTQIGTYLGRILARPRNFGALQASPPQDGSLSDLLQILFARTRVDFRDYKQTTVMRRIERRMGALGFGDLRDYTHHVRTAPREADALFKDLLISVTRFFRDRGEFAALAAAIGERLRDHAPGAPVRAWVAGCATGEEAYSVAILFAEALGGPDRLGPDALQLFATDIDRAALRTARAGLYPPAALDDLDPGLVQTYFRRREDGFAIVPPVKDAILFSEHNVFQDPPFLNLDLVCCRNLLIYFTPQLQGRVLARFDYALKPGGLLFLGTAEAVAGTETTFRPVAGSVRLFRKRAPAEGASHRFRERALVPVRPGRAVQPHPAPPVRELREARALFQSLVQGMGPDALLLAPDLRILEVHGDVSRYLSLTTSTRPQLSVTMLREPFAHEARTLATLALRSHGVRQGVRHPAPGTPGRSVQLLAVPLASADGREDDAPVLLFFRETEDRPAAPHSEGRFGAEAAVEIDALQREVQTTREALQQTVQELETSNEELQALNEELQSTNEELQATNEELETANEELQSTNQELITVNEEQQVNAAELAILSEELAAILASIPTPVIVVDASLHITRASTAALDLFGIRTIADRPHVSQLEVPAGCPPLAPLLSQTLHLGLASDAPFTAQGPGGPTPMLIRTAPISDARGRLIGASAVLVRGEGEPPRADGPRSADPGAGPPRPGAAGAG